MQWKKSGLNRTTIPSIAQARTRLYRGWKSMLVMPCDGTCLAFLRLQLDHFCVKPFVSFFAEEFAALRDSLEHSKSYERLGARAVVWIFQFKDV